MFKSKVRGIVIPQYEHERLAGVFARAWGNASFARPDLNFDSFVQGVTLHDWHYGVIDNLEIGSANENDWLRLVSRGVANRFDDAVTDVIVKLHIRRLLSGHSTPQREELIRLVDARITERLPGTGASRAQFEWADKITRFCDHLAFDFCFETPTSDTLGVFTRPQSGEETSVTYEVLSGGRLRVDPWPFSVDQVTGIVIGYQLTGYPDTLNPVIIPFLVEPGQPGGVSEMKS